MRLLKIQVLEERARETWQSIAAAPPSDQPRLYWRWCQEVIASQENSGFTIRDAAKLLIWPDSAKMKGLEANANVLIVLDTAEAIDEGCAYDGVTEKEQHDWTDLSHRVARHLESTTA